MLPIPSFLAPDATFTCNKIIIINICNLKIPLLKLFASISNGHTIRAEGPLAIEVLLLPVCYTETINTSLIVFIHLKMPLSCPSLSRVWSFMKYKFKDTTTTEYVIEADSEEEAVAMLDKLWWTKQNSIKDMCYQHKIERSSRIWIEY